MATLNKILTLVDELKPNQFQDSVKIEWISNLEYRVINEVVNTHMDEKPLDTDNKMKVIAFISPDESEEDASEDIEDTEDTEDTEDITEDTTEEKEPFSGYTIADMDAELIAPDPYSEIYKYYVMAMIDFTNGETDRYTNSMVMFNMAWNNFFGWYNRTHTPKPNHLRL